VIYLKILMMTIQEAAVAAAAAEAVAVQDKHVQLVMEQDYVIGAKVQDITQPKKTQNAQVVLLEAMENAQLARVKVIPHIKDYGYCGKYC
jgi:hypothetical protein